MYSALCHVGNWGSLGDYGAWGWAGLALTGVIWVGLLAALGLLAVWAIRRSQPQAAAVHAGGQSIATEILQARYARGEITREQYESMKRDLK